MVKTIPRTEWLKLVADEIEAIKQNADPIEKLGLTTVGFSAHSANSCIYGLMTGHCRSIRGMELIHACSKLFVENFQLNDVNIMTSSAIEVRVHDKIALKDCKFGYFSCLESYIFSSPDEINYKIIAYIKGQTDKFPELT